MQHSAFCAIVQARMGTVGAKTKAWVKEETSKRKSYSSWIDQELPKLLKLEKWLCQWKKAFQVVGRLVQKIGGVKLQGCPLFPLLQSKHSTFISLQSASTFLPHLMMVFPSKPISTLLSSNPRPTTLSKTTVGLSATWFLHLGSHLLFIPSL